MLVKLNKLGPVALATAFIPNKKTADPSAGQNIKPRVLVPGINDIPDEEWAALKENPTIKRFLEEDDDGHCVLVVKTQPKKGDKTAGKGGETPDLLNEMTADQARKIVRQTLNKPLLERWKEADSRNTVIKIIDKQLAKLVVKKTKTKDAA